ncbi:protein-lysine N-methyltransferase EEF2KMT [Lucilia sericata]|uniref:protein-lysine N-methyltransferase EEF2KMT n=1 Tax=Lucilia sericata TaxID=13632 RepID=UPI0018A878EF|nr:protein-lysine N-methyltransferase EEF2KMT [Lucilia sericata]
MPESDEYNFHVFLKNLQKQFLCCYPLHCIQWENFPKNLTWEQQKNVIDYTINSPLNKEFPIKLSYQLNFLKKLLIYLEKYFGEIHDEVYENYCLVQANLASDCTEKYAFKHYIVTPDTHFTIRESKSFVAEGTTGLCSWQASLALADFLVKCPSVTRDKSVLELGAGTGLCGFIMLKMCQPRHVLLSDGSSSCVELMRESFKRNFPQATEKNQKFMLATQTVEFSVVKWDCICDIEEVALLKADVIIAADVVYDDFCFADLSSAIDYVFKLKNNKVEMYLAATVRNEHTLNGFLYILDNLGFHISECDDVSKENSILYWDRSTPVKILKLVRQ